MNFGIFVVFWIYGISILISLLMICGEHIATTYTQTKFNKFWRKYIIEDGNDYPFE